MAHHGGRTAPLARTHRPRAPIMSVPAPVTAPLAPLRPTAASVQPTVTLTAPRPDTERTANEYVETPFRPSAASLQQSEKTPPPPLAPRLERPGRLLLSTNAHHHHHHQQQQQQVEARIQSVASTVHHQPLPATITKQPIAFTKEHPGAAASECASSGNIICQQCSRCRCESCKQPRALPERWVCHNACLCSADAVIDYVSCLCCVKGLYYHCSESDAGATCADDPCSCGPSRRLARWGCLSALAAVLPCLLCYWPLRACQRAVEAAYARHSRAGCRCPPRPHAATPEKRLLDTSPDF